MYKSFSKIQKWVLINNSYDQITWIMYMYICVFVCVYLIYVWWAPSTLEVDSSALFISGIGRAPVFSFLFLFFSLFEGRRSVSIKAVWTVYRIIAYCENCYRICGCIFINVFLLYLICLYTPSFIMPICLNNQCKYRQYSLETHHSKIGANDSANLLSQWLIYFFTILLLFLSL